MSFNLLEMVQDQLGGNVMSMASKFLGESETKTTAAMGAALPSILGGLISKGSSESGASGIMDMLKTGGHDGGIFDKLPSLLGGGDATSSFINSGGGILKSILGNNMGSVVGMISKFSGIGQSSSSSLLSMAAPMIMGMLGKKVLGGGMGASGLMNLLMGQKDMVSKALPAGMGSLLGLSGLGNAGKEALSSASSAVTETADAGGSMLKKILPIAILAVLAFAAWKYFGSTVKNAAGAVTEAASGAAGAVADVAGDAANVAGDAAGAVAGAAGDAAGAVAGAAGDVVDGAKALATKALEGVQFAAGSVGEGMSKLLSSDENAVGKSFAFKNLNFATGSADITDATRTEVDNLAAVLKAYPNLHIEVAGHTDNTGNADSNKKLSLGRADSVKNLLVSLGIEPDRIKTQGLGADKPTADNGTKEGRAANRRIEVTITKN